MFMCYFNKSTVTKFEVLDASFDPMDKGWTFDQPIKQYSSLGKLKKPSGRLALIELELQYKRK